MSSFFPRDKASYALMDSWPQMAWHLEDSNSRLPAERVHLRQKLKN